MSSTPANNTFSSAPPIAARLTSLDGILSESSAESIKFVLVTRAAVSECAKKIVDAAPADTDFGRLIATLDALTAAADVARSAVTIGERVAASKKRKTADEPATEVVEEDKPAADEPAEEKATEKPIVVEED